MTGQMREKKIPPPLPGFELWSFPNVNRLATKYPESGSSAEMRRIILSLKSRKFGSELMPHLWTAVYGNFDLIDFILSIFC